MVILIWFNPDTEKYEWGTLEYFEKQKGRSINRDRFLIMYKFDEPFAHNIARKISHKLNIARQIDSYAA